MKHNLEKKFSTFDLLLGLALIAVLVINIAVIGSLRGPGERKASKDAVTVTGTAPGKVGDVSVEVVADAQNIYSVTVTAQNETPGIGSLAVEELPAAIGKANSLAVDGVSTATVTSDAIKAAVANALESAGFDPAAFGYVLPEPEPAPAAEAVEVAAPVAAEDGKVTAQGKGSGIDGDVIVEVTADENTIYEVNILQQNETPGIGSVAVEKLPGAIVAANSLAVDGITGATVTSTAIKTAVTEALTSMGFDPANYASAAAGTAAPAEESAPVEESAPAEESVPVEETAPAPKAALPAAVEGADGKVTAYGRSLGKVGDVTVEVVADADTIYAVTVTEQNETAGIGSRAVEEIPAAIVAANSIDVDAVSGATITSDAIRAAAAWALRETPFGKTEEPAPAEATAEPTPVEPGEPVRSTASSLGKNGPVTVEVLADRNTIYEVTVLEHSETKGVGSVAVDWIPARIVEANSIDVDAVSGATVTTDAIRAAVAKALRDAPYTAPKAPAPAEPIVLESTVSGRNGPMVVSVTADAENIYKVKVLMNEETVGVGSVAVDWLPGRIVEANSIDIDGITGATITSDAIKLAVSRALEFAASGNQPAAAPAGPVTVQTAAEGRNGPITVEVTVEDGNILDVKVLEHSETVGVGAVAVDWLPGRIVEANSIDIDGITGATVTSDAIKSAVRTALDQAA